MGTAHSKFLYVNCKHPHYTINKPALIRKQLMLNPQKRNRSLLKQLGFSLIELLIVIAVIAIVTAVAIPTYQSYILRAHRADGIQAVSTIALNEEEYMLNNGAYTNTLSNVWDNGTTSQEGFYTLTLVMLDTGGSVTTNTANATGFQITATATGTQTADSACTPLVLMSNNASITKTPSGCW